MSQPSSTVTLPPITLLNTLPSPTFIHTINTLFETAPPLASALYAARPFNSYEHIINHTETLLFNNTFSFNEKLEIINAHPRIGESKKTLSVLSYIEQGYSQPNTSNEDEETNKLLMELNKDYERIFGFKFVVFVNGRPRKEIIPVLKNRLECNGNSEAGRMVELEIGLREMVAIARDRLGRLSGARL